MNTEELERAYSFENLPAASVARERAIDNRIAITEAMQKDLKRRISKEINAAIANGCTQCELTAIQFMNTELPSEVCREVYDQVVNQLERVGYVIYGEGLRTFISWSKDR